MAAATSTPAAAISLTSAHDQHNVGRDQYNIARDQYSAAQDQHILHQAVNLNIFSAASQESIQQILSGLGHFSHQQSSFSSAAVFRLDHDRTACDMASNLIVEITQLLDTLSTISVDYLYLQRWLLKLLLQTLFLIGIATRVYEDTVPVWIPISAQKWSNATLYYNACSTGSIVIDAFCVLHLFANFGLKSYGTDMKYMR